MRSGLWSFMLVRLTACLERHRCNRLRVAWMLFRCYVSHPLVAAGAGTHTGYIRLAQGNNTSRSQAAADVGVPESALPLSVDSGNKRLPGPGELTRWMGAFLVMAVAVRLIRYALRFPLWCDEAFLSTNFIDKTYADQLGALAFHQVCPILFLWIQLTIVKLLGFTEYTLRLFPLLCGLGSVALFYRLSGRLLAGTARVFAFGVFAVAFPVICYASEAKQYGCDLFVTLVLLTLVVEWYRRPDRQRWLWALCALTPIAVGLSYPAVFIAGGLSVAIAYTCWRLRSRRRCWAPWLVYNLLLVGGFAFLLFTSAGAQSDADLEGMRQLWAGQFPPWGQPLKLIGWLIVTHTSRLVSYPIGGKYGAGTWTFVCCVVGLVVLIRRRHLPLVLMCLTPLMLQFIAALLRRYPYGGPTRFSIYAAPLICLVAGLGGALMATRVAVRMDRRAPITTVMAVLMVIGVASIGCDLVKPHKTKYYMYNRDFARWFWPNKSFDGELVCMKTDLNQVFSPRTFDHGESAVFLCNQRIYFDRIAAGERAGLDRVSRDWPLRCVRFRNPKFDFDKDGFHRWLDSMKSRYDLVGRERYPIPIYHMCRSLIRGCRVELFEFEPKRPKSKARSPR